MGNNITRIISNCLDCDNCETFHDPDPNDWFCSDDMGATCLKTKRDITRGDRPHQLRNYCEIPDWCPYVIEQKELDEKVKRITEEYHKKWSKED